MYNKRYELIPIDRKHKLIYEYESTKLYIIDEKNEITYDFKNIHNTTFNNRMNEFIKFLDCYNKIPHIINYLKLYDAYSLYEVLGVFTISNRITMQANKVSLITKSEG